MTDAARAEVCDQLRQVILWEMEAQVGARRPVEEMPELLADTLLDYFDVTLKTGVDLAGLD